MTTADSVTAERVEDFRERDGAFVLCYSVGLL